MNCIFCGHPLFEGKISCGISAKDFYYSTTDDFQHPTIFHNPNCDRHMFVSSDGEAYHIAYGSVGSAVEDYYINHCDPESCATICYLHVEDIKIPMPKNEDEFFEILCRYDSSKKKNLINFK